MASTAVWAPSGHGKRTWACDLVPPPGDVRAQLGAVAPIFHLPSHIAVSPAVLAPCHSPHVASYRSVGVRTASVVSRQLFFPVARCSKALSISHVVDVLFSHRCIALVSSTGDWLLSPVDTGQPDSSS
jgi:hypothetical protein